MEPSAVIMMVVSLGIMWGGLAWSILRLRSRPEPPQQD